MRFENSAQGVYPIDRMVVLSVVFDHPPCLITSARARATQSAAMLAAAAVPPARLVSRLNRNSVPRSSVIGTSEK